MKKKKKCDIFKICFCLNLPNDSMNKLISNYEDIIYVFKNYKMKYCKIFCFNDNISLILGDEDKNIIVEKRDLNNLSELFFLSLLISSKKNSIKIDYEYSFENIKLLSDYLNSLSKNKKSLPFRFLIICKIVNDLFFNFKGQDEYDESEEKIVLMEEEINKIIDDVVNLDLFKNEKNIYKFDLNENIDSIYLKILISLIENNKFDIIDNCLGIMEQLDLINIDITETIFDGLNKIINKKNKLMEKYTINEKKDLEDKIKINFYYILFKYILKNKYFMYNNKFLFENYKRIKKIVKKYKIIPKYEYKITNELLNILDLNKNNYDKEIENNRKQSESQGYNLSSMTENNNISEIENNREQSLSQGYNLSSLEYNLEKAKREKDFGREESKVELDNNIPLFSNLYKSRFNDSKRKINEDKDIPDVKLIFPPKIIEKEKAKKILNKLTFKMNIINEGNGKTIKYKEIKYG